VELDMERLTIMGHGFGATTAIMTASKDNRIKKVVTYDPWVSPLKEEILSKTIMVHQPHCSVNSEIFQANAEGNWEMVHFLFKDAKRRNS
jgi:cephalosporin-C deacetylase-like acetyl esterase